jgi:hypothetical protein
MTAYREFLLRVAKRHGAHFTDGADCRTLFIENGRFVGVQVASTGSMIGAGGGILGVPASRHSQRFSWSGGRFRSREVRSLAPAGWKVTLAMTIESSGVPEGLCSRAVWKEERGPALEMEIALPSDYALREPESRLLFLRTVLPYDEGTLDPEGLRLVFARMLRKASELIPFLDSHLVRVYPDFRGAGSADEVRQAYPYSVLAELPANLLHYQGEGMGSSTGVEGLHLVSGESYPKLGSLGPTVAGLESVAWLAHHTSLPDPFT